MKTTKIMLLLLICIMGTTACGRHTPFNFSSPELPVTESSTKKDYEATTAFDGEMTPFEMVVRNEGGQRISSEELSDWTDFFSKPVIPLLLSSDYENAADIDMNVFMYFNLTQLISGKPEPYSEEELKLLFSRYPGMEPLMTPLQKNSVKTFDELLTEYMGITLEDTHKKGLEEIAWLDEYQAYYFCSGDGGFNTIIPTEAARIPDGSMLIHWKESENPWGSMEGIVKLRQQRDKWMIESNCLLTSDDYEVLKENSFTKEELNALRIFLDWKTDRIPCRFLICRYEKPEEMDCKMIFCNGTFSGDLAGEDEIVSEVERDSIIHAFDVKGTDVSVVKCPRTKVIAILKKYTTLSVEGIELLLRVSPPGRYAKEYDAYYSFNGCSNEHISVTVTSAVWLNDEHTYAGVTWEDIYRGWRGYAVMEKTVDSWRFLSNQISS